MCCSGWAGLFFLLLTAWRASTAAESPPGTPRTLLFLCCTFNCVLGRGGSTITWSTIIAIVIAGLIIHFNSYLVLWFNMQFNALCTKMHWISFFYAILCTCCCLYLASAVLEIYSNGIMKYSLFSLGTTHSCHFVWGSLGLKNAIHGAV